MDERLVLHKVPEAGLIAPRVATGALAAATKPTVTEVWRDELGGGDPKEIARRGLAACREELRAAYVRTRARTDL